MALLIDINAPQWMRDEELRALLQPLLPGVPVRSACEPGDAADIIMLATVKPSPGRIGTLPNLRLVQKLGAGVESILGDPELPAQVRVARLRSDAMAQEIAEYCLAYVLRALRNMAEHESNQRRAAWEPIAPRPAAETVVGVLGIGHIGTRVAGVFAGLGFKAIGWSRTAKFIEGIECRHGGDDLAPVLARSDFVVSVLPSTPATRNLFDARRFAAMKAGSVLINVGRADLIVEDDLLHALDSRQLAGAVLDVHRIEPLPADHPFWRHLRIIVTPHVSGWHLTGSLEDVAENYRRLVESRPLLHEVDRRAGY
jgi:glyoxylate/hydroxypyruvate reductase A